MTTLSQTTTNAHPLEWVAGVVFVIVLFFVLNYATPLILRAIQVRRWRSQRDVLALTYDDGPDSLSTGMLLDLLEELDVRASFYLVGFRADQNRDVLNRLVQSEHQLATHTHSHKNAWKKPFWFEFRDAMRGYTTLADVIDQRAPYRPPFGKITMLTYLGMRLRGRAVHWWTIAARDTLDQFDDVNSLAKRMLDEGERVVLMHCHHAETHRREYMLELTRALVEQARERGIALVTMHELGRGGVT